MNNGLLRRDWLFWPRMALPVAGEGLWTGLDSGLVLILLDQVYS